MRRRLARGGLWFVLGLGLAGLGSAAAAEPASSAAPLKIAPPGAARPVPEIEKAAAMFRKGDADEALKLLREAVHKHPELSPPQVILGTWFSAVNQVSFARSALEQAVIEAPNDPEAYALLGEMALRGRMMAEAELLFGKALELVKGAKAPSERLIAVRRRSLAGLAATADARQDWKGAQRHLEALLAEAPKDASALEQLGRLLFQQKKPEEALARFREAAKVDEAALAPEATLAQLYQQAGDSQNAGKWMLAAIQASPRDFKIRLAAAQWEFEIGRYAQADEQADAALRLDPNSLAALMLRGAIAIVRRDYKTAEEVLEKAHLQAPGNVMATNNLALALAEQNDDAKKRLALEYAQLNARQYPDQPDAVAMLGWVLYRQGRVEEAEANFRKVLSSTGGRASQDTLYFLARYLADRNRKEDARKFLESAMKTPGTFLLRQDAKALLDDELSK